MKFFKSIFCLLAVASLTVSCLKQSETIRPIAPVKTLAELQRESMMITAIKAAGNNELSKNTTATVEELKTNPNIFYLNIRYNMKDIDVYNPAEGSGYEMLSNAILRTFAKLFLKVIGEKQIDIGTLDVPLPSLNLDFNIIRSVRLKRVYLTSADGFGFIKTLNIKNMDGTRLLSYSKTNNTCKYDCLDFAVESGDIMNLINNASSLKLKPYLTISGLPQGDEMKMDGAVELQIGLLMPF